MQADVGIEGIGTAGQTKKETTPITKMQKTKSKTPLTDREYQKSIYVSYVGLDFCKRLEARLHKAERDLARVKEAETDVSILLSQVKKERDMLLNSLQEAISLRIIPTSSASDGGANRHSEVVACADRCREAVYRATH